MHLLLRDDGRITGDAFVFLSSEEEASRAEREKDRQKLGERYLVIRAESRSLAQQKLRQSCRVR